MKPTKNMYCPLKLAAWPKTKLFSKWSSFVAGLVLSLISAQATPIIIDDFNVNEGHFTSAPNASGSSRNIAASSTADRVTTDSPVEGAGHEKLVLTPNVSNISTN